MSSLDNLIRIAAQKGLDMIEAYEDAQTEKAKKRAIVEEVRTSIRLTSKAIKQEEPITSSALVVRDEYRNSLAFKLQAMTHYAVPFFTKARRLLSRINRFFDPVPNSSVYENHSINAPRIEAIQSNKKTISQIEIAEETKILRAKLELAVKRNQVEKEKFQSESVISDVTSFTETLSKSITKLFKKTEKKDESELLEIGQTEEKSESQLNKESEINEPSTLETKQEILRSTLSYGASEKESSEVLAIEEKDYLENSAQELVEEDVKDSRGSNPNPTQSNQRLEPETSKKKKRKRNRNRGAVITETATGAEKPRIGENSPRTGQPQTNAPKPIHVQDNLTELDMNQKTFKPTTKSVIDDGISGMLLKKKEPGQKPASDQNANKTQAVNSGQKRQGPEPQVQANPRLAAGDEDGSHHTVITAPTNVPNHPLSNSGPKKVNLGLSQSTNPIPEKNQEIKENSKTKKIDLGLATLKEEANAESATTASFEEQISAHEKSVEQEDLPVSEEEEHKVENETGHGVLEAQVVSNPGTVESIAPVEFNAEVMNQTDELIEKTQEKELLVSDEVIVLVTLENEQEAKQTNEQAVEEQAQSDQEGEVVETENNSETATMVEQETTAQEETEVSGHPSRPLMTQPSVSIPKKKFSLVSAKSLK